MVCFMPGFVTEPERADLVAGDAEEERLTKLFPEAPARVTAEKAIWRKTHPEPVPATLADVANHIDHIRQVAGIDHLGLGADFEGFHGAVKGLEDVACYPALLVELMRRGYTANDIKKIAGLNLLRVLEEAEKVSARLRSDAK
jgi:membrane dipeptidase